MTKLFLIALVVASFIAGSALAAVATLSVSRTTTSTFTTVQAMQSDSSFTAILDGTIKAGGNSSAVGATCASAPEANKAFNTARTALVRDQWYYEFTVREAVANTWPISVYFKVTVFVNGSETAVLYVKNFTNESGNPEGATIQVDLGSGVFGNFPEAFPNSYTVQVQNIGASCP